VQVVNEEIVNGRARRYYALTDGGRAALVAEAQRMADAAQVVIDSAKPHPTMRPRGVTA
jgi:DNA-binding PadR family transcriptional regulator